MERLFAAGARDVFYTPVFMKKNRPAYLITVLCSPADGEKMEEILFAETSTIGIRRQLMDRRILERETGVADTSFGSVAVKMIWRNGEKIYVPEYESVAALAREKKVSFRWLYQHIEGELNGSVGEPGVQE